MAANHPSENKRPRCPVRFLREELMEAVYPEPTSLLNLPSNKQVFDVAHLLVMTHWENLTYADRLELAAYGLAKLIEEGTVEEQAENRRTNE